MRLQELGFEIRKKRLALGLTQAQLADTAGVSRTTVNQFESGIFPDLGVRKVISLLDQLGLTLDVQSARKDRPDFIQMACTTANVSFRATLTEDELIRALLTGKAPARKKAHLRTLLDDAPTALIDGLVKEVGRWSKPGRVETNLARLAVEVGASKWQNDD